MRHSWVQVLHIQSFVHQQVSYDAVLKNNLLLLKLSSYCSMTILTSELISMLAAASFLLATTYLLMNSVWDAIVTTRKFQHLPWIGTSRRCWWQLLICRMTNVFQLRARHDAAVAQVSSPLLPVFGS